MRLTLLHNDVKNGVELDTLRGLLSDVRYWPTRVRLTHSQRQKVARILTNAARRTFFHGSESVKEVEALVNNIVHYGQPPRDFQVDWR